MRIGGGEYVRGDNWCEGADLNVFKFMIIKPLMDASMVERDNK